MEEKDEARDVTVAMQELKVNLSPDAFHIYATHYYKCKQDFTPPDDYPSPIPYFLLCRAIELEIKARHLKRLTQKEVKKFSHCLLEAYEALDAQEQMLSQKELAVLKQQTDSTKKKTLPMLILPTLTRLRLTLSFPTWICWTPLRRS